MISVNDAKYIHLLPIFRTFQSFSYSKLNHSQIHSDLTYFATNIG